MSHQQLFGSSQMFDMDNDRNWGQPNLELHAHLDPGNLYFPQENVPSTGVNSSQSNLIPTVDYSTVGFHQGIPNYIASPPPILYDPYMPHPATNGSINQILPSYDHSGFSSSIHYHQTVGDDGSTVNSSIDYTRMAFKRKSPALPSVYEQGNSSGTNAAGNSTNSIVSDPLQQNNSNPQCVMWNLAPNHRGNNLIIAGEASHRNVRSRHTNSLEENQAGAQSPNSLPPQFHTMGSSANYSGNEAQPDLNVNSIRRQANHLPASMAPHGGIMPTAGDNNFGANQSLVGHNVVNVSLNADAGYRNAISGGNLGVPLPSSHGSFSHAMGMGHSSYNQDATFAHRGAAIQSALVYTAVAPPLENGMQSGIQQYVSSRLSRPLFISGGRNVDRGRRMRGVIIRSEEEENIRNRMMSQALVMINRSAAYNSRSLRDQHRDMRLDIDNMTYEELLDLEERIGYVNTGLSDDMISKCVRVVIYCSSDESPDDGNCAICLEDYKDSQDLGVLKCGHDFHSECIKKWLGMKSVCPICKTETAALVESHEVETV
ncbi:RING-H2 finger protein ATL44 [Acorus gramineus]|uniref:RING-type E3 ubiquitin transferase n=1 Tax=Acorus gramineus TaxID=55184 RepID=A0AAV9B5J2_ACOGR|nr:RING-H2 finger protein ATL44 [Acorus gramineus]